MQIKHLLAGIIVMIMSYTHLNANDYFIKYNYLTFQTGFLVDNYNSLGFRMFFEYKKDQKYFWQYGISYENVRHFTRFATDHPMELETNLNLLCLNYYYKLFLYRERVFIEPGIGVGGVHVFWDDYDKFGVVVNASITLNVRVTKKIFIETSPLFILTPSNRIYFSTMKVKNYHNFYAFSFFPFGLKFRL